MDDTATTRWDVGRELDNPVQIDHFLDHLHDDIKADVAEELFVLDGDFRELLEDVSWDVDGLRADDWLPVLHVLFSTNWHGGDASCHVLGGIHLLQMCIV